MGDEITGEYDATYTVEPGPTINGVAYCKHSPNAPRLSLQ